MNIGAQTDPPTQNHRKGKKNGAQPPLPATSKKTSRIHLGSKSDGGVFFFPSKCKTIRPGAVKGSKTDPKRDQKANANK